MLTNFHESLCLANEMFNESPTEIFVFFSVLENIHCLVRKILIRNENCLYKFLQIVKCTILISLLLSFFHQNWQPWKSFLNLSFVSHVVVFCKKDFCTLIHMTIFFEWKWLYPERNCLSNYAFKIIRFSTHYYSVVDEL